jgi:hypothetical protein
MNATPLRRPTFTRIESRPRRACLTGTGGVGLCTSILVVIGAMIFHPGVVLAGITVTGSAVIDGRATGWDNVQQDYHTLSDTQNTPNGTVDHEFGTGASYGRINIHTSATVNPTAMSISGFGTANAGATGFGQRVDLDGTSTSSSWLQITSGTGSPFLFKVTGSIDSTAPATNGSSGLRVQGNQALGWSGNEQILDHGTMALAGVALGISLTGVGGGTARLLADGNINANGSYSATVEIDENVVRPPSHLIGDDVVLAAPGRVDAVVNYLPRTTHTGLTPPFANVDSIIYSPPSGSTFSYGTHFPTSTVNYKWGAAITETFVVRVIPGFAPADMVRVSWNGLPIPVFYQSPALPPGTVSSLTFNPPSGQAFAVGETVVRVTANVTNVGPFIRTFKVNVIDGSTWAASGPPAAMLGDSDGDGQADWLEAQAGTDPNDAADRFQVQAIERIGDDIRVSWFGTGGVTYQLQSIALTGGAPASIGAPVTTTAARALLSVTDVGAATAQGAKFYRVVALPQ